MINRNVINRHKRFRKTAALTSAVLLGFSLFSGSLYAEQRDVDFSIKSQPLAQALMALAQQSNMVITLPQNVGENLLSPAVTGNMTPDQAIQRLLVGTNLSYEYTDGDTIVVKEKASEATSDGSASAKEEKAAYINEIIVTAEKREQNLQNVPSAISAFSSDMLRDRGIDSPQDLQFFVPGLNIGAAVTGTAQVTIRGIGSENLSSGGDPGVPIHIDGHYIQSSTYILQDMFDVERVEVQRGPQGTLYGRNAVGGNINIITKRPTDEFEGLAGVDLGNYGKRRFEGVVSGPLTDSLRARLSLADEKRDGYVENASGRDPLDADYTTVRLGIDADLTDNLNAFVSGYYYKDKALRSFGQRLNDNPDFLKTNGNGPYDADEEAKGISVNLAWDMGEIVLKSLTSYNKSEDFNLFDRDRTPTANETNLLGNDYKTISQEFQLLSDGADNLNWVAGVYYYREDSGATLLIEVPPSTVFALGPSDLESKSYAAFGQVEWAITEQISLIGGLRYTEDEKDISRSITFAFAPPYIPAIADADDSWSATTGKLGLNFQVNEDVMLYASYSRGYKAGGFNYDQVTGVPYDPEFLDAYEVGLKSELLDNRLRLNFAGFYYDYTDKQEQERVINGNVVLSRWTNAGAATVKGVEVELVVQPASAFFLDATLGYQDSQYDEFMSDDGFDGINLLLDLSGNQLARAPELTWSLGAQYVLDLDDLGSLTFRADHSYSDGFNVSPFVRPQDEVSSRKRTNARISWADQREIWTVDAYIKNIDDDVDISNFFPVAGGNNTISLLPPREYGIKVRYQF